MCRAREISYTRQMIERMNFLTLDQSYVMPNFRERKKRTSSIWITQDPKLKEFMPLGLWPRMHLGVKPWPPNKNPSILCKHHMKIQPPTKWILHSRAVIHTWHHCTAQELRMGYYQNQIPNQNNQCRTTVLARIFILFSKFSIFFLFFPLSLTWGTNHIRMYACKSCREAN